MRTPLLAIQTATRKLVIGAIVSTAACSILVASAQAATVGQQAYYCGPSTLQAESTSTRSSTIDLKACLDVSVASTVARTISVRPTIVWGNSAMKLPFVAVDFNSINIGGSFSTPTLCPTLPAWTQPPLSIVNAADNFGWSTTNSYTATGAGTYSFTARITYDVKDDGLPARTLYATVSRPIG